jgi:hypothetical protein
MNIDLFMGKPLNYWVELQNKADELNVSDLILDNAMMRAKVSFYEAKLNSMFSYMDDIGKRTISIGKP